MFTSSVTDSVRRERPDGVTRDEGIALAISEERGAADGFSQPTESVTEEVNTAEIYTPSTSNLEFGLRIIWKYWEKKLKIVNVSFTAVFQVADKREISMHRNRQLKHFVWLPEKLFMRNWKILDPV